MKFRSQIVRPRARCEGLCVLLSMLVLLAAFLALACGASARERTVRSTLVATNAARAGFMALDEARQEEIIDKAASVEQGQQTLKEYRKQRDEAVALFIAVYQTIAVAFSADFDEDSVHAVLKAAHDLDDKLDAIKKKKEP